MRVAILGLGAMGSRMAVRLLRAGHTVTVYNRSSPPVDALQAAGAIHGITPRSAVEGAEIVIAMVRDDEASRTIWCDDRDGALKGLGPRAIAIESSTLTPGWIRELSELAHAAGACFLDAPVVGSRPQAENGQLIYLVGGDKETLDRAKAILLIIGATVHHVGPVGAGAILKLAANALFGTQVAAIAEIFALLNRLDCDPHTMADVLNSLPVTSPAAKGALALILANADAPLFPIELVEKDFGYALGEAKANSLAMPVTAAAHQRFETAKLRNLAASNITAVARLYDASS
jgi:3-hydroxyisobutyrate dehydrogenase